MVWSEDTFQRISNQSIPRDSSSSNGKLMQPLEEIISWKCTTVSSPKQMNSDLDW